MRDERVLAEDDADAHSELIALVETTHGYLAMCVQCKPARSSYGGWTNKQIQQGADLLASTATRTPEAGQHTTNIHPNISHMNNWDVGHSGRI
jgi:hypothetical protein